MKSNKMVASFGFATCVCGYHVYQEIWTATDSAQLRPGSCLLPQVGDLNRFIDYHLRVYVEILPKSREVMRRVRDHSVTTCCLEPSAVQRSDRVPFAWHYTASLLREHSLSGSK